jgi:hypothetical protein
VAVAIHFNENQVPMNYKMRINDYLSQIRTESRPEAAEETAPKTQENLVPKETEKNETNK